VPNDLFMIKLQVVGNLGKDAVVKEVNGKTVINFNVAHTEKFKDAQGVAKEKTTWVECSYWTDRTAVVPYLKKGTLVYTEGSPEASAYQNKEGQNAASLRLRVSNVQLLGGSKTDNSAEENKNTSDDGFEDLPF
jgi:single-strand DNA-binding protein